MIRHDKLILFSGINDIDALFSQKKLFFPPLFTMKVHLPIRTNMDSHNNLVFFMVGHHKVILFIGISDIDALDSFKMLFSHYFLELEFVRQLRQEWVHIIITFLFMIGGHKLFLLIGINDIDALVS